MVERWGNVDMLVNNAGVIPSGSLFEIDEKHWREGLELKVFGYINLCRLIYPRMKAFEAQGSEAFSHTYSMAAARFAFHLKDPRGWAKFRKMLGEHSAKGSDHKGPLTESVRPP